MSKIKVADVAQTDPILDPGISSRRLFGHEHGAEGFSLSIATMDEGLDNPEVCYPDHDQIIYILSGTVELTEGGQAQTLQKGKAIFIPRGQTYGYKVSSGPNEVAAIYSPAKF